MQNQASRNF